MKIKLTSLIATLYLCSNLDCFAAQEKESAQTLQSLTKMSDILVDGKRIVTFSNGTIIEYSKDRDHNDKRLIKLPSGTIITKYKDHNKIVLASGTEILNRFDGVQCITLHNKATVMKHPDGTIVTKIPGYGTRVTYYSDATTTFYAYRFKKVQFAQGTKN